MNHSQQQTERIKKLYPPGTRIELIEMKDPYSPIPPHTRGTVRFVDDLGTIFPKWDNGRELGIVPGEDSFRRLTQEEAEAESMEIDEPTEKGGMELKM